MRIGIDSILLASIFLSKGISSTLTKKRVIFWVVLLILMPNSPRQAKDLESERGSFENLFGR